VCCVCMCACVCVCVCVCVCACVCVCVYVLHVVTLSSQEHVRSGREHCSSDRFCRRFVSFPTFAFHPRSAASLAVHQTYEYYVSSVAMLGMRVHCLANRPAIYPSWLAGFSGSLHSIDVYLHIQRYRSDLEDYIVGLQCRVKTYPSDLPGCYAVTYGNRIIVKEPEAPQSVEHFRVGRGASSQRAVGAHRFFLHIPEPMDSVSLLTHMGPGGIGWQCHCPTQTRPLRSLQPPPKQIGLFGKVRNA